MQRMSSHLARDVQKVGAHPPLARPSPALRPPHPLLLVVAREGERRAVEAGPGHSPSPVSAGPYRVARSWQLAATVRLSGAGYARVQSLDAPSHSSWPDVRDGTYSSIDDTNSGAVQGDRYDE